MMRLTNARIAGLLIATLAIVYCVCQIYIIYNTANKTLVDERARQLEQSHVSFEKRILTAHPSNKLQILQNINDTRSVVTFNNSIFAATSGGLAQYSEDGKLIKHFTVLDGLPESDLTALAVFQNRLFIGTRTKDLVAFDGEKFENYLWTDRKAQAVTALLESDGSLLIGTFGGGLLEFNGETFAELKAKNKKITAINCLQREGAKLFVGTYDNGLWIYQSEEWTHLTIADGLLSNRVMGIVTKGNTAFIATDFGLSLLQDKTLQKLAMMPTLSGLVVANSKLLLVKDNGQLFTFEKNVKSFSDIGGLKNARLLNQDDKTWLVSSAGISLIEGAKIKSFTQPLPNSLSDNFVSAIALDNSANLWVGTFRNGIDVVSPSGGKRTHIETESIREINFLASSGEAVTAASSNGIVNFKNNSPEKSKDDNDALPSPSVTHFSGDYVATAKGLVFRKNGKLRVISNVQGLPSNSVYSTLQAGKKLYAGTLGGLAEIENDRVVRTYKDSNSGLTTNWVTALIQTNDRLFIGTYGGGVFELTSSGAVRSFESEAGKFTVNPNALFSDGERLYAGTLDGVRVLDLQNQEWHSFRDFLPASTVMSIAGDNEHIYFGTTNGIARVEKTYFAETQNKGRL